MTPQERQLVDDLFERLARLESAPRDPDAAAAIAQGQRIAPNAIYGLVQTVLVQDEALKRAHERIQQLEAGDRAPEGNPGGGFLDTMRDAIFGQNPNQASQRGSVPNVPPPGGGSRPSWNTGQVLGPQQGQYTPPGSGYGGQQGGGYGGPQGGGGFGGGAPSPVGGGGGSFLGTAAAAAAGVVGGSLLLSSIRGMMGGGHQSMADQSGLGGGQNPWGGSGDQSGGSLAQQAGLGDIGSQRGGVDDSSRYGAVDQGTNESGRSDDYDRMADAGYDHDDMDDGFDDGGGDSDFA
ncbi:DUF2076 domain-containing protein [Rhodopseudomonas sp. HC1]|uniref:DUF2076 domain-containing protein n=1 Tax=Rhodopseudomonas infernalis TaxID=2897386 RepID=UPI001EE85255|nr:DUF2076 domain-containing protein [Rhodopseudomonas infernalis]MCG6207807.1 DUF2076 domain-containing protein [Rhodopseudomonas infernalis]